MSQLQKRQSSHSSLFSRCAGLWSECPALLLQGFTVHTSICLPPPFPLFPLSLPSLLFCRMLQGKENLWKRFQELFSLPWCQSVHAPGWLSPPFPLPGSTTPSPRTKDRSCYPSLVASRAPAPGAGECILERARYMQLPAPPLKDKIPFPHSHPGKM